METEARVVEAMRQVMHIRRVSRVYPYQLVLWTDVGYSEQHLRRLMSRLAKENIITRVGGEHSRRGYTLQ
jgi:DNA-binding IscR family transcriptional regulator